MGYVKGIIYKTFYIFNKKIIKNMEAANENKIYQYNYGSIDNVTYSFVLQ